METNRKGRVEQIKILLNQLYVNYKNKYPRMIDTNDVAKSIISNIDEYRAMEPKEIEHKIIDLLSQHGEMKVDSSDNNMLTDEIIPRIKDVLSVPDATFTEYLPEGNLDAEFHDQVCNVFSGEGGKIQLQIKNSAISVFLDHEGNVTFDNPDNISLRTEAVYPDDPFVLDDLSLKTFFKRVSVNASDHRNHLRTKLLGLDSEKEVIRS